MDARPRSEGAPHTPQSRSVSPARQALAALLATACLAGVALCFWFQDLRFSVVRPAPEGWRGPEPGAQVGLAPGLAAILPESRPARPLLLHFYNPDCPCSRYQLPKLRDLVGSHGEHFDLVVLIESRGDHPPRRRPSGFPASTPFLVDPQGNLAAHYGVHTTPQAVLLDADGRLVYRGNYASSRVCVDPRREYVRLALEALIEGRKPVPSPPGAYGCPLPVLEGHSTAPGGTT